MRHQDCKSVRTLYRWRRYGERFPKEEITLNLTSIHHIKDTDNIESQDS